VTEGLSKQATTSTKLSFTDGERDDARLVALCRSGDQAAWDTLVERYQRLVYTIPRRAGLSEDQASDVFQEVFLTLFQKIGELDRPERVRSWVVTTAKFKTWSVVRNSRGSYSPASDEEMENEIAAIADPSPLAEDVLIEIEEQQMIRTALERLDEKCHKILSMIYLRQPAASYAEVGSAIGVGETSISPMRSRCLKKLGKLL